MIPLEYLILIPKNIYSNPRDEKVVLVDKFWLMTTSDEIVYYTKYNGKRIHSVSPQCNDNFHVCKTILENMKYPIRLRIERIPVVYTYTTENPFWNQLYNCFNARKLFETGM